MFTVGSLFAGIGGIDLGLERVGAFKTVWFCERDLFCQQVLARHWPNVPVIDDVHDVNESTPAVDVITAGFPCQPVSHAGRRKAQNDERWLWPEVGRCIRILRPRGILLENVTGLLTAGFDDVIGDLAACGYDAEWDCIPAAAVGAPHRRDRIFILAHPAQLQRNGGNDNAAKCSQPGPVCESGNRGWPSPMADAYDERCRGRAGREQGGREQFTNGSAPMADASGQGPQGTGNGWTIANRAGQDRIWPAEPGVGRVANGVSRRVDRLRALGNAVVPKVAEYVGWQLLEMMGGTNDERRTDSSPQIPSERLVDAT